MAQPPNYRKVNPADTAILMLRAWSETLPLTSCTITLKII